MACTGAPFWYFTISAADTKHPICLYYADTKQTFNPFIQVADDRFRLIDNNPVAGAQFFHSMVQMFIKHILGINYGHKGLYGDTSAYYGTVEQVTRESFLPYCRTWIKKQLMKPAGQADSPGMNWLCFGSVLHLFLWTLQGNSNSFNKCVVSQREI